MRRTIETTRSARILLLCGVLAAPGAVADEAAVEPGAGQDVEAREAGAQSGADGGPRDAGEVASDLTYVPPTPRGVPEGRWGAGTRTARVLPRFEVLAPDHVGLTTRAQPVLYWYLESPSQHQVAVTLVDLRTDASVLEITINAPVAAGIRGVRLADHGIELERGVRYQWLVALVPDPVRRANDVTAGGVIERVAASTELERALAGAGVGARARVLAGAGIWYDAFDVLSEAIERGDGADRPRALRASLLSQVGLGHVQGTDR